MTQNTKKNLKNDFISLIEQSSEEVVETLINYHPLEKIAHSHMIQYVSTTHMKKLFDDTYEIYEFLLEKDILDRHNKVIDVGCGIGLLKWICRNNGYITYASETYLQSSFSNGLVNFDPYQIVRKYLDVDVDVRTTSIYSDDFKLDWHYDYCVLSRFAPIDIDDNLSLTYDKLNPFVQKFVVTNPLRVENFAS